jgi:hypothetical protein
VLIDGDPVADIGAIGNIAAVWCAAVRVTG